MICLKKSFQSSFVNRKLSVCGSPSEGLLSIQRSSIYRRPFDALLTIECETLDRHSLQRMFFTEEFLKVISTQKISRKYILHGRFFYIEDLCKKISYYRKPFEILEDLQKVFSLWEFFGRLSFFGRPIKVLLFQKTFLNSSVYRRSFESLLSKEDHLKVFYLSKVFSLYKTCRRPRESLFVFRRPLEDICL